MTRRSYVLWFFFCAGWGYLMAESFPGIEQRSIVEALLALPLGALTVLMIMAVELWRLAPGGKLLAPSLSLKPWNMPVGVIQFVSVTFLFSSIWGLVFAPMRTSGAIEQSLFVLSLGVGGLVGLFAFHHLYRARFVA
jgi:hypothetical protein